MQMSQKEHNTFVGYKQIDFIPDNLGICYRLFDATLYIHTYVCVCYVCVFVCVRVDMCRMRLNDFGVSLHCGPLRVRRKYRKIIAL